MKDLPLLIWITQLGLSTVGPPALCVLLAVWARQQRSLGSWVIVVGIVAGIIMAIDGFRTSLKLMSRLSRRRKDPEPPPVSFNDHD